MTSLNTHHDVWSVSVIKILNVLSALFAHHDVASVSVIKLLNVRNEIFPFQ